MIGRTIRSANRNAITPPKEIPPDHSTAARGTLPDRADEAEHGHDRSQDHVLDRPGHGGGVLDEQRVEEPVAEQADEPGEKKTRS